MKVETTPYAYSDEPYEGPNNPLRLSGQLEGDHRLDLLLLPFILSIEEKEVGAWGRSSRESPNEPPTPTRRIPRKPQQPSAPIQTNPMKVQTTFRAHSDELRAIIVWIFFCFLFFYQEKKRKSGRGGEAPTKVPTNLLRQPNAPHEGPNSSLHPFSSTP